MYVCMYVCISYKIYAIYLIGADLHAIALMIHLYLYIWKEDDLYIIYNIYHIYDRCWFARNRFYELLGASADLLALSG